MRGDLFNLLFFQPNITRGASTALSALSAAKAQACFIPRFVYHTKEAFLRGCQGEEGESACLKDWTSHPCAFKSIKFQVPPLRSAVLPLSKIMGRLLARKSAMQ